MRRVAKLRNLYRYLRAGVVLVEERINGLKKDALPFRRDHLRPFRLGAHLACEFILIAIERIHAAEPDRGTG